MPPENPRPRVVSLTPTTIWIVAHDDTSSSWRVWRGPRTVAAIERELARERGAGRRALVEIEIVSCSPTEMTLPELAALGIVEGAVGR